MMRDLKNTDVVVNHTRFCTYPQRTWGQNNKEQAEILFNSYANLSSDIDLMNGPDSDYRTLLKWIQNWAQGAL
jgi:hypothetical protein